MTDRLSAPLDPFKDRELEILRLMAEGYSNQGIADQLYITKETVRWYNKQIYSKLGTSRRTEAIALARSMGLLSDDDATTTDHPIRQPTLPLTTGPFIGRDGELTDLIELLQKPDIRLLSIIAAGGMGKSRLSLEVAHHIKTHFEHGAIFVDLTTIRKPDAIIDSTLDALALTVGGKQSPQDTLFNFCMGKDLLLIFDNFEHVLTGASLLSELLEVAPRVKIIITSRERLNLRLETTFYLQPIIEHGDHLFLEVAEMMHPHVTLTKAEQADVNHIVELVGGSPLALIIAANWLDTLSVAEISEEIRLSLDFLSAEMGDMPERQRSIHAVVDPTWKRLNAKEQHAFMWASVFRGGFTRDLFQQVTETSARTLQTLLNRSLISHATGRRFEMHPLLRQYAREKLEQTGELAASKQAHLAALLNYAQHHANCMYDGQHYLASLEALDVEQDNIRAALEWALAGNNIDQGVALILANGEFWLARSMAMTAITDVEKAIQQSDEPMLHYWRSVYLDRLGDVDGSLESTQYVIEYGKAHQQPEILAYGQKQMGMIVATAEKARPLLKAALSHAQQADNQHLIATCYNNLSVISSEPDENTSAQHDVDSSSMLQKSLEIYEELGDLYGISRVTNNLAIQYSEDPEQRPEAKPLMEYSLQLKRQIGDRAGEARRLTTLSLWAIEDEDFETAQTWLAQSRALCEELGEQDRLSYVLTTQGTLHIFLMNLAQAQATLEHSLQIHHIIRDYKGVVDLHGLLGQIHLLQNNLTEARQTIVEGIEIGAKEYAIPTIILIAYANYRWQSRETLASCVSITATLAQQALNTYYLTAPIVRRYFLQPLIYRVQQYIGDEAWQQALEQSRNVTIEQRFQDIVAAVLPE